MSTIRIIEICHVAPLPLPASDFSLPLSCFDSFWLKFPPTERIFFYRLSSSTDIIMPRLKRSLSLALRHFLPLAGKITWPENADVPFILYTPNDVVSLTIAESTDDFELVSGDRPRDLNLSRSYVPKLHVSGSNAAIFALQVTLFPRQQGLCVGLTDHHGFVDGKSYTMFIKAWAHVSKELGNGDGDGDGCELTEALTPFLDRTVLKDPDGIALEDFKTWMALNKTDNPKSLEMMPKWSSNVPTGTTQVRGTFKLSRQNICKLKEKVQQYQLDNYDQSAAIEPNRLLSSFVVSFAHTVVCMAKAKREVDADDDKVVKLRLSADCRSRLNPPLPSNYFGNCIVAFSDSGMKLRELVHYGGIARVAHATIKMIKTLDHNVLDGAKGKLGRFVSQTLAKKEEVFMMVGVAGSTRFEEYGVDFGFGRPVKVEIASIDRITMSMVESRDGSGSVEVGVVMLRHEMDKFASLFVDGLENT